MDVNSRDPSQNIIPFRIKGVEVSRFDSAGNLGIGTTAPTTKLDVAGDVRVGGTLNIINSASTGNDTGITLNGVPLENKINSAVVVNMDSQPAPANALNRQKKQTIPLTAASTLSTSDVIAKMSGVSVGKSQIYGVGAAQMASYGNIVVAVGEGTNSIAYSLTNPPTAASWVGIPNSAATFTTRGRNIAYANGTWVAVGEGATGNNSIAYSTMTPPVASSWIGIPNNISFNAVTTTNTFSVRGNDIAYGNGAWVAVGSGINSVAYSLANPPTAESWVGITTGSANFGTAGLSITFGNGTWVATGEGTNGISYSTRTPPTADSWVVVPLTTQNDASVVNTFGTLGLNIAFANGVWLAAGQGTNTLCYSVENPPIAGSWMPITASLLFGSVGRSLTYGNGTWVACGDETPSYPFSQFTFTNAGQTGRTGPTLSTLRANAGYNTTSSSWTQDATNNYLNIINNTQLWTVPTTGEYTIRAVGAGGYNPGLFGRGRDIQTTTRLIKGEVIRILVGQMGTQGTGTQGGGGGGTFVVRGLQTPIIVAGGGGGRGNSISEFSNSNASESTSGNIGGDGQITLTNPNGVGGVNGLGGGVGYGGGGGGLLGNGISSSFSAGGFSFINAGFGGSTNGGFGGGGAAVSGGGGGGGGGYSGGGGGGTDGVTGAWTVGGGGGSFAISTMIDYGATNTGHGSVTIIFNGENMLAYSTARIPHSSSWVSMKGPTPSSSGQEINHVAFNVATNTWYFTGDISSNCMFYSTATPPVPATWVGVPRSASTFTTQAFGAIGITTNAFTSPVNVARLDNKVTFPANRMLAVGGGGADVLARSALTPSPAISGTISYSDDDGATWAMVPGGATNAMFSSAADISANTSFGIGGSRGANAVAWNGEKWVAAGNGRTHSLAFSDDGGMTWSGITGKSIFSVEARDVAWNGQMWVAVGRGEAFSTAYSYDGVTWMGPIDASGAPINVFSLDIAGPSATASDISGGGNHVIWTGKMWVATGTRTQIAGSSPAAYYTVAYSTDGKTWTGVPDSGAASTGFDMYAHGVAWNGRNYVATGRGTVNTLVTFTDVTAPTAWQGLGNSVFSVWGRGITWGAKRWMATGRGTNTVAYSTNGRNWQGCGANVFKPLRRFMAMGDTPLYTTVPSGQPQRGVAFSYSDDGVTWDAPVVNQGVEFNQPLGGTSDTTRSVVFTNNTLLTNVITDISSQHTALMFSADGGASWARVPGTSDTEANGGTGMTVANNGCYSLAANPTRTRFLAGGGDSANATRKVYFSNDGFNWRNSISSPNAPSQMAWVWASLWIGGSYNRWLIGGNDASNNNNGRIMVSGDPDAVAAWATATGPTFTNSVISCFAANTDFSVILAGAASGNTIYRSINGGATWPTTIDISGTPLGSVRSIAFSPSLGRWVAVGGGGGAANTIIYSTDATGTAWIAPPLQAKAAATAIFKNGSEATRVIWDTVGGRFLVGGWNGAASTAALTNVAGLDGINNNPGYTMAYSADGMNWTPVTVQSSDTSSGSSVSSPFLTRCRDIMALDTAGDFTPINTGYSVTWNSYANRFVATGNGTCPVVYSNDGGVTWTPANQQPPQQAIAVAGGASAAASAANISPLTYTIDGKTWFQGFGAKEIFGTGAVNAVEYGQTSTAVSPNGRIWVAGGAHTSGTSCLAFSQNGIRWTAISGATTMMTNVRTIVYAPAEQITAVSASSNNAAITATSGVGNGVWVAGGDTTISLVFSYDGISWSEVPNSLTILSRCNTIAFGNGLFVAGGVASSSGSSALDTTANIVYSTDGITWRPARNTVSRISTGASISSITYGRDENGRGIWVAGATTPTSTSVSILYSYNGMDWVGVSNSGSTVSSLGMTSIAYGLSASTGRGLWIAGVNRLISDGNAFVVSTNGRDGWTAVPNTKTGLFDVSGGGPTSISYFNGVWYATGSSVGISAGRTLAYSYDGSGGWFGVYPTTNMYGTSLTTFSLTDMRCVATTNDYILPSGASAGSSVSSGTAAASFRPAGMNTVRSIGWTAGVGSAYLQHPTIVVGADNGQRGTAISTDGGRTWGSSTTSLARSAFRGGVCNDLFWNGSIWAAVGHDTVSGAKIATSKDGVSWSQIPGTSIPVAGMLNTVAWNGSIWMVGGDGSPTNDANTASFAWSSDLATWTGIANTDISLAVVKRIAWNGMYWVAVGQGVGVGANATTIMYSKNRTGLVWEDTFTAASGSTTKTSAITTMVNDVVWGGGRWVAVGGGNSVADGSGVSILYSVDAEAAGPNAADYAVSGRRWVGVAASAHLFPYGANSIAWNGKRFIATGPASSSCSTGNIIAWSADGISWNAYSTTKTVAPGQRWVAVGSGSRACIATSVDGRIWTDVANSATLFSDISGASAALVNTMKTGARAVGWNGSSLIVGGARSATTTTPASQATATSTIGRTTIPVCAFIGSGNGVMGGGTTNVPDASFQSLSMRVSSSVYITHMDVNIREANQPWGNMWLNTYTDLSATQLFQVTPESHTLSSALKWNGWSWVANFGLTTSNPLTGEQYGSIWYCTDPLARVGWSVASNSANPRILIGQGGYAALEWNGVAWLACGYDPNNNNLIYTTDKYGAIGWTAVSGIVSGAGSASFQPVCIASSSRFWVVGGSQGTTAAMYFTSDRTGATGWRAVAATGGSVLPGIRISSVGYNGSAWICCGGGGGGTGSPASSISWRADTGANEDIGTGWATATISGTSGGIPPVLANGSSIVYNAGAASPRWVVVGDVSFNSSNQIAYTTTVNGSIEWKIATGTLTNTSFGRLTGIAWTGYSWIATSAAGASRILNTMDITGATGWNSTSIFSPTISTNAVAFVNIPISLLTTGMPSSAGAGAGTGAMWRAGAGRAQGLLPSGGTETTSVVVRSTNGAEGASWSQTYSRNFLIAVGGGVIRDAANGGGTNRMAYSYDGGLSWTTNNTMVLTNAAGAAFGTVRTVKYGNGMWVAGGDAAGSSVSGNNCLAWSRDGVNWTGAGGTQIFGSAGACYAVCCNDRGRWVAVGGAPLGTAGTYTNTSGSIYTMAWSDDGMNWTPILGSRALFGIVCQGVSYGADASGVGMWTAIGRGTAYTGCAYSYDGKTWYLSQTSGSLFGTSVNVLTERYAPVASASWRSVSLSSTGQYQTAVVYGGQIYTSSDYGVNWTARDSGRNWNSVSISSTGQYQTAVVYSGSDNKIYTSSDYGINWTARDSGRNWISVSLSSTGQYQTAVVNGGQIYTSSDYGVNWTARNSGRNWNSVSISSTGQYQTAVVYSSSAEFDNKIYTSSDYGINWTARDSGRYWISVSLSSTGQYQTAVVYTGSDKKIYTSSDYGVNWTARESGRDWRSVSLSSTGQYQTAVFYGGQIYTSSDYGVNWTARDSGRDWFSVSLSSTGQYQTAVVYTGSDNKIYISSNFGETWSSGATDSRSLGVAYGKDATGAGMWVATAGRRDRDVAANIANTMAYSYDGKLWRGIRASAGLSEQAWSVAYGKDGFGVGMWVAAGYDRVCGLKWSYDGVTWNASMGASGAAVWAGMAAGRRALSVYWNGSMWLASTSDTRNGSPSGTPMAANNASSVPGYLLYSYNGKNWLPVLAPNTYSAAIGTSAQASVYSVLPNPAILDFGSFYDDQAQRGMTIANTTARTVGAVMSGGVPVENINTIVPYGRGSNATGQVPFLLGGDSGLVETAAGVVGIAGAGAPPPTSDLAAATTSLSTSADGGITWRAVPNSTRVMTKVNKILCDETTQQIVAVGTGNYSVATSTPARAADADGWTGVFGSRMTDTRAGLFEKYGTGATWFGGAKMWIASGRAQSRRGSSLAVSVNGTVWQDAKIVTQTTAGSAGAAGAARGGGLTSRTTGGAVTIDTTDRTTLYTFTTFTFDNAGATGRTGPDLSACRTRYATTAPTATWAQNSSYLNMTSDASGIQLWTVPATGSYTIRAVGAAGGTIGTFGRGRDIQTSTVLTKGEVIKILVGQKGTYNSNGSGGGGTFVVRGTQTPIIVAGGGGGRGGNPALEYVNSNASNTTSGNKGGDGSGTLSGAGGIDGGGGSAAAIYAAGGGGLFGAGGDSSLSIGGASFISGGIGGSQGNSSGGNGGFGGGGGSDNGGGGGGGGGYSGGGGGRDPNWPSGGGGGSFAISTMTDAGAINTGQGSVTITFNDFIISTTTTPISFNSALIPYTAPATPLLTYTDSAAAFSTQVSSVAVNSQYNRAVVGGSGVQFVAGGRGGLAVSNDGQNWSAAAAATVFQTPTNTTTRTGSGGFDASFGTVALTQRLTTPATYASGTFYSVSLSKTGQYQTAVVNGAGQIYTSSDYGVNWTARDSGRIWKSVSLSSTGQYQTAAVAGSQIYTSSNYGVNWTERDSGRNWRWVSLSSTGQYQTAVVYTGQIYTSSDYGANWMARDSGRNWISVSLSSTGQYQTAVVYGGQIYTSSDYGVNWTARDSGRNWYSVSLSSTGQYQTAVVTGGQIYTSSNYGVNWTARDSGRDWYSVSISSTGQYQTAVVYGGQIYTSSDYGVNWTARDSNRIWHSVSLSSTGQYQTAVVFTGSDNNIFTSTDFGLTWVQRSTATRTNAFTRIKSSASGQYQLATSGPVGNTNGQLYVSSDYGQTWIPRRGLTSWLGGAVSATGAIMTTFSTPTAATAAILRSTDYGATFSEIAGTTLTGTTYWRAIAATNSAATQTALAHGSTIYRSTDYGSTWNSTAVVDVVGILTTEFSSVASPTLAWKSIAMSSADAKIQTGVVSGGQIYVNSNYGREAWTAVDSSRNWTSVAMSADGRYQSAVVSSGAIYYNSTSGTGTWTAVSSPAPGFAWTGIAVSSADGKYQTAVASGATNIYVNSNFGVGAWTAKESARNWFGVAMSATGQYQTAVNRGGYIYIDASFGASATWTPVLTDSTRDWVSVAMSVSGQYQTAVVAAGKIYVNNNYGASGAWTETESNRAWISVAVSGATGRYQTAVAQNAQIYINANFGAGAWTAVDSSRNWVSVTVSADGKYQRAAVATSGQVYFSRDFGATWSTTAGLDIMGNRWQDVAISAETGAVQVTCVSGGYLYVSNDTGSTWNSSTVSIDGAATQTTNRVWQAVAVSANGQYGLACVNSPTASGYLYRSTNSGATWNSSSINIDGNITQTTNRAWRDVGMSANGKYQVACINAGSQSSTTSILQSAVSVMVPPPGSLIPTFGGNWAPLGESINGENENDAFGNTVAISADGTIVAIGANSSDSNGENAGRVQVYKYNPNKETAQPNKELSGFGPIGWDRLGADIDGETPNDASGLVAISADGTTVAIGAGPNDGGTGTGDTGVNRGHVRVYKYNPTKTLPQTNQELAGFGPIGWDRLGADIDGEAAGDQSSRMLSLSSDGNVIAIGASRNDGTTGNVDDNRGHVRVYRYTPGKPEVTNQNDVSFGPVGWTRLGADIDGENPGDTSGASVALSADGTTVVIGAQQNNMRVYKYNPNKTEAQLNQELPGFGPIGWDRLGADIDSDGGPIEVSISADGTVVAIGTISSSSQSGRVRVYKYNLNKETNQLNEELPGFGPIGWDRIGADIVGEASTDNSGYSVDLSADGTIVAIGAPGNDGITGNNSDNRGHVRVYKYNPTKTLPQTNQELAGFGPIGWDRIGNDIDGDQTSSSSGVYLSISSDGSTVAISAQNYASKGRVRVYKIPVTNAITYTSSSSSIADICGNLLLIKGTNGTTNITSTQTGVTTNGTLNVSGTTYTLTYTANTQQTTQTSNIATATSVMLPPPGSLIPTFGGDWGQLGLDISGNQAGEGSGWSVSLSADGTVVAIGSITYDNAGGTTNSETDEGRTRIYKYNGTAWNQLGPDISCNQSREYSISVSLSADGTVVAIGSNRYDKAVNTGTDEGRTRIYKYNGTSWNQMGVDISGNQEYEWCGTSVSLSADGTTVAIGSNYYDTTINDLDVGRTRIYKYNGTSWNQLGLDISGTQVSEYSGYSVSLSADGTTVAIGSHYYDNAVSVNEGRTRVYKYNGTSWNKMGADISGNQENEQSGNSVSLSADGTTVAIGSSYYDNAVSVNEGRTRVYKYNGTSWNQLGVDISGNQQNEQSGYSVSLSADGTTVAIGSPYYDNIGGTDQGRVRIYRYNGTSWGQLGLDISGNQASENSGYSVTLSADGTTVAIGSYYYNTALVDAGRVRVYTIPVTNAITYTSSSSSIADVCGNLLLIKGVNGSSNIVATQNGTTTTGTLNVSGTTYTITYTLGVQGVPSFIYYSKNYGASWTIFTAAGSRPWSSIALSENGSTISATTTANDASGGVWVYSMPDDQFYRTGAVSNTGATTPATVRAIAYGNSGTGAAVDGYWVAGADAAANSLAYSSNGVDWTAVVGSKTTLFNAVNGVAYGADTAGTPMWVAVGLPFVGSVPGTTAFSIAYSYNMTTWVGVRNAANFTGQGNHVAYGQDEFGAGVWVAVGQADGILAANLGDSALYNSNGTAGTTIFYSYDGANWAAGTGLGVFAVSGTDIAWGVDASGVGTWVATGIGYTDPLTGVVVPGGQVAHSTNGRVWAPIRAPVPITPAMTPVTLSALSRVSVLPLPPASSGFTASLYGSAWDLLGAEILGTQASEYSGYSVSLSADGTTVAIGSYAYDKAGGTTNASTDEGRVRIYKYNKNGTSSWDLLGAEILGTQEDEYSGVSVSLSADGTTVAIGSLYYDKAGGTTNTDTNEGRVRIYKYNKNGTSAWDLLGAEILGTQAAEYSGNSVSLSADGTTVAIGSPYYDKAGGTTNADTDEGRVRIYKYNKNGTSDWDLLGAEILGTQVGEESGSSVSLSADGTTVAIGSRYYDKTTGTDTREGRTRIYKYNKNGTSSWDLLGAEILGTQAYEYSGYSVTLSADGTTVAIGAYAYDKAGGTTNANTDEGRVRIYKYNKNGTFLWDLLGAEILGTQVSEYCGYSVSLSADGTTVAIGAQGYDKAGGTTNANTNEGRVRIYKYNKNGTSAWDLLGAEILGTQVSEESGYSVSLSADGTTVAIGSRYYDKVGGTTNANTQEGRTRVYKLAVTGASFSTSNPAVAEINNGVLLIKDISAGSTTITATQPATPPFTSAPVTVQGTLDVSGTTYTLTYHTIYPIFTPFPGAFAGDTPCVAYGRAGSQGTGAPRWIVGGAGGTNVFAMSSAPTTLGAWSVVASNAANAPFPVCNSIGYSNGVWVAGNNTAATNILARSTDGGATWTPVTASSVSGILTGAAAVGANSFCNYSLAYADYSSDTNLRSWVAVQGTKNFMFDGGVSAVATPTPNITASAYNGTGRAWWVAGGRNQSAASIAYTSDPSGATGWTLGTSTTSNGGNGIADLEQINAIVFSPHTQNWLAVGVGSAATRTRTALYSVNGISWTSAVVSSADVSLNLNTCAWNQLDASASAAGRWLAGGTRYGGVDASAVSLYISADVSGHTWTPIVGTGAILSQVYSLAYNGSVWIAAGTPATDNGSTSTLMRTTTDPTGATGWQGIPLTNISTGGFDTAARSITWNADQQMWVATGENTGSSAGTDASFSSVIYSRDATGAAGTWRTVRESNSFCFSGEGTSIAFKGDKWFAAGQGTNQIVATTGTAAANAGAATWTPITHGTALTSISDIAYTGRRLIATGSSTGGASNGVIYTTDNSGSVWTAAPATPGPGFNDALGGGTSITFEPSIEGGAGHVVATGRSATNAISLSTDGGVTWNVSAAPSVQFSTIDASFATTTQPLFTTGGNSVAYVGNDTLFAGGANNVQWTGKRWVATGRNTVGTTAAAATTATANASTSAPLPDVINNNTSAVATSDDGMTWQSVSASQAPNLSEGTVLASNPRIGPTPLINSQIIISDGGDTEANADYGGMNGGIGGSGTGIAQIDIIAELPPVSNAASSIGTSGAVNILGAAGNGGANGIGNAPTASFDTTGFTITTRPI